jgi:hypothetical protein
MMAMPFLRRLFGRPPEVSRPEPVANDAEGQYRVALEYDHALGGSQDLAAAAQWYLRAAEQSHASAQFQLGRLYAEGRGVGKDDVQALQWIQKAAQQGLPAAQFDLGMRHYRTVVQTRSRSVPELKIEAYKWLHLAAARDFPESETVCSRVILSMTQEEVTDGNRRVAAFQAEHCSPASTPS